MIRHAASSLLALIIAAPNASAMVVAHVVENTHYLDKFSGAPSWTTFGVHPDSGVTANNADALSALPGGVPIIGDCPGGGFVQTSSSWAWPSNLILLIRPNCAVVSTNTASAFQVVRTPALLTAKVPTTNVEIYGLNIRCATPTQAVRAVNYWIDHLKLKHWAITGCGCFVDRGSDREVSYGVCDTTPLVLAGNPGFRDLGNLPHVQKRSPGMWEDVDKHHNLMRTGDASLQVGEPALNPNSGWQYQVGTDGILYRDTWLFTYSTGAIVNEENTTKDFYSVKNATFEHIFGSAFYLARIVAGGNFSETRHIHFLNSTITKSLKDNGGGGALATLSIGNFNQNAIVFDGKNMSDIDINNIKIVGSFRSSVKVSGTFPGIVVNNSTFGAQNKDPASDPNLTLNGTSGTTWTNDTFDAGIGADAVQVKGGAQGDLILAPTIVGVGDGSAGVRLLNATGTVVMGGSVKPAPGSVSATGVALTSDPNGAHGAQVHGVDVSTMPIPIKCPPAGQGNDVSSNPGAADCP